ncbi:MAG: hypothetical protein DRP95_01570 [Candidatus Latescibacterota bacterium]|nr:MAG: hypothetical protein DRP95_01570 [Candidatus Latescibacterota bacterium]
MRTSKVKVSGEGVWIWEEPEAPARLQDRLRPGQRVPLKVLRRLSDGRMLAKVSGVQVILEAELPLSVGGTYWAVVGHLGDPIALRICKAGGHGVDVLC